MNSERLDAALEAMVGDDELQVPGLGVIVYVDGAETYSKFLGRRNLNEPFTRDSRFRAASVSKAFTIFTLMQLVERGLIDLDEDVEHCLGFPLRNPSSSARKITVRMLASHTSSLRDGSIYSLPPDVDVRECFTPDGRFWEDGKHFAPASEPVGEYFTYCNLNYGLLGTIIERVTGERFDRYQKANILRRLDTDADYVPANLAPDAFNRLGTLYRKSPRGTWIATVDDYHGVQPPPDTIELQNPYAPHFNGSYSLADYRIGSNATCFSPQGGLRISTDELSHALEMILNDGVYRGRRVLSSNSIAAMLEPQWIFNPLRINGDNCGGAINSYGLGVYRIDGNGPARLSDKHSIDLVGHTGAAFGMLSGLFVERDTRNGVVYMINGLPLDEENDPRARGRFGANYVWEESIVNAVVEFLRG